MKDYATMRVTKSCRCLDTKSNSVFQLYINKCSRQLIILNTFNLTNVYTFQFLILNTNILYVRYAVINVEQKTVSDASISLTEGDECAALSSVTVHIYVSLIICHHDNITSI